MRLSGALALCLTLRCSEAAFNDPIDLFVAGEPAEVNNYRIPALTRTRNGVLIAVAEARSTPADCCYKYLVYRRSFDNGTTWTDQAVMWGQNLTDNQGAGNPVIVHDTVTGVTFLHGSVNDPQHCSPTLYTFQLDDGGSDGAVWGNFTRLAPFLGSYDGATPGPGTGTQVEAGSPFAGRLIVPAHYGVYNLDVSWYSDDHGKSWTLSTPPLPHLDEVVVAALPSGRVLLNARTAHYNSSCNCRAVTTSEDGGATWDLPLQWDATLIEPVCQASMVTQGPLPSANGSKALFFSNPASTTERANLTVRRSDDGGASWQPGTWLVHAGEMWGGYSCMAGGQPMARSDAPTGGSGSASGLYGGILWERDRPAGPPGTPEAETSTTAISFALFPLDAPSQRPRTFISASHPSVTWQGRTVVNGDGSVSFDFPAVTASLSVANASYWEATFLSTCPGGPRLESSVDDAPPLNTTGPGSFWLYGSFSMPHTVALDAGLDPNKPHSLKLRTATEARWAGCDTAPGGITLSGFWTDGTPLAAPLPQAGSTSASAATRFLEFVGDSITAGYGTAPRAGSTPCPSLLEVEDSSRAAPVQICAALGASCSVVAVSGDTVITPPPPGPPVDKPPLPIVYPRALTYNAATYNFSAQAAAPNAIIVNLGTNDAILPNFDEAFTPALTAFLLDIASPAGYWASSGKPVPTALLYCGPMTFSYCEYMKNATDAAVSVGASAIFLGPINATLDGCNGHPGPVGQAQMAAALTPLIASALGW